MSVAAEDDHTALKSRGALDTEDAALYMGFARATLKKWRTTGFGPSYVRVGSKVVYRVEDLNRFLKSHRVA